MSQRHWIQNNRIMFVTTATLNRESLFGNPAVAREAVETLYRVRALHPFLLYGFVIMPDHCHFLMMVQAPGRISNIIGTYKSGMTSNTGIPQMWQPRSDMRIIKGDPLPVLHYIYMNPVKAGLTKTCEEYPWSSASGEWEVDPLPRSIMHLLPPYYGPSHHMPRI
jgi:REP-associated tyrosine transposase